MFFTVTVLQVFFVLLLFCFFIFREHSSFRRGWGGGGLAEGIPTSMDVKSPSPHSIFV